MSGHSKTQIRIQPKAQPKITQYRRSYDCLRRCPSARFRPELKASVILRQGGEQKMFGLKDKFNALHAEPIFNVVPYTEYFRTLSRVNKFLTDLFEANMKTYVLGLYLTPFTFGLSILPAYCRFRSGLAELKEVLREENYLYREFGCRWNLCKVMHPEKHKSEYALALEFPAIHSIL